MSITARRGPGWTGLALDHLDPDEERPYWIVTAQIAGFGPMTVARLLADNRSLQAAWDKRAIERVA